MKPQKNLFFIFLPIIFSALWIVTIILKYVFSFVLNTEILFYLFTIVNLFFLLASFVSIFFATNALINKLHIKRTILLKSEIISIISGSIALIIERLYDYIKIDYSLLSLLGYFILILQLITLVTFIFNIVLFTKDKNTVIDIILIIINLLVSIYPIFLLGLLLFLGTIGFGPPS